MFYTWGLSGCPTFVCPICLYAPVHLYVPRGVHTPICPHTLLCLCVFGGFACCGGCNGFPCVGTLSLTSSLFGGASSLITPHTQSLVPCTSVYFRDISMLCGHFPSVRKGWGCFCHQLGGWGCIST